MTSTSTTTRITKTTTINGITEDLTRFEGALQRASPRMRTVVSPHRLRPAMAGGRSLDCQVRVRVESAAARFGEALPCGRHQSLGVVVGRSQRS